MTAESKKDACLIEDGPHSFGNVISHVFPPVGTWIVDSIIILQSIFSMKQELGGILPVYHEQPICQLPLEKDKGCHRRSSC